eukprot:scaffold18188_cov109-Isochrysis_galbana.AAC.2
MASRSIWWYGSHSERTSDERCDARASRRSRRCVAFSGTARTFSRRPRPARGTSRGLSGWAPPLWTSSIELTEMSICR